MIQFILIVVGIYVFFTFLNGVFSGIDKGIEYFGKGVGIVFGMMLVIGFALLLIYSLLT